MNQIEGIDQLIFPMNYQLSDLRGFFNGFLWVYEINVLFWSHASTAVNIDKICCQLCSLSTLWYDYYLLS